MFRWYPVLLPVLAAVSILFLSCSAGVVNPTPASSSASSQSPSETLANQDNILTHCVESEISKGFTSHAEGAALLRMIRTNRDPGDTARLSLLAQCIELGYLDDFTTSGSSGAPSQSVRPSRSSTRSNSSQGGLVPTPTSRVLSTPLPVPTPTLNLLPAELTSGVDALVHCAGETTEYWLEYGPPRLTAELASCINSYLGQMEE